MQHKITKPSDLLDKHGELVQKGYATSPLLTYHRKDVARKLRLKEWDYYLIYNDEYAIAITLGKSNLLTLISASLINLTSNKKIITKNVIRLVSNKKLSLPESSETGDIVYQDKEVTLSFRHLDDTRELFLYMKNFTANKDMEISINLTDEPEDSMVIATPFQEDRKGFYYNRKIIGFRASGFIRLNNKTYSFHPNRTYGLLDWGRGVWPYKTTWYWSAAQGMICGNLFGFNLGYGFGDTSAATENMLFFNGIASKLKDVTFHIPKNECCEYEYIKPWTITSSDHRLEMIFTPILDRSANLSAVILSTDQHQVFGKFSGTAILDDDTIIYLNDFLGFAERVENRW
jgi:hypothetical protein